LKTIDKGFKNIWIFLVTRLICVHKIKTRYENAFKKLKKMRFMYKNPNYSLTCQIFFPLISQTIKSHKIERKISKYLAKYFQTSAHFWDLHRIINFFVLSLFFIEYFQKTFYCHNLVSFMNNFINKMSLFIDKYFYCWGKSAFWASMPFSLPHSEYKKKQNVY